MKRTTFLNEEQLESAMMAIDAFCEREYGEANADYSNMSRIPVAYTEELGRNSQYTVQIYYDLEAGKCITEISDFDEMVTWTYTEKYKYADALIDELQWNDFDILVNWWFDVDDDGYEIPREDIDESVTLEKTKINVNEEETKNV